MDSVVTFLLDNISQLLANEVKLLSGLSDEVRDLHSELLVINAFLKDSEGKRNEHEIVKAVINQIRDVAHEAEDLIDTFIAELARQRRRNSAGKLIYGVKHRKILRDIAKNIVNIKKRINEIYEKKISNIEKKEPLAREELDLEAANRLLLNRRRAKVEEDDVVGFDDHSTIVIKKITEGDKRRDAVSIIGMGGLGKTTLARKVYNNNGVKKLFDCRAWVSVSEDYRAKELLLNLLEYVMKIPEAKYGGDNNNKDGEPSVSNIFATRKKDQKLAELWESKMTNKDDQNPPNKEKDVANMNEAELKEKLRECLVGKKYLIVLDDIWKTEDWDDIMDAFPDDFNGSRILITSRIKDVAAHASASVPYFLPFLDKEESWKLFSKKVFRGDECPPRLEAIGRSIAENCDGLPLSIVVIAGLLAKQEKSLQRWERLVGHVNSYLNTERQQYCKQVLALSYNDLPRKYKPCFLYFGLFPEDFEIPVRQLTQLWVAEGLIREVGSRTHEDVAENYLDELIDRSLIQVASRRTDGGVKTCRIHDLLRDLCIREGKEDKFFQVCTEANIANLFNPRRLSIHCSLRFYQSCCATDDSHARSLFFFGQNETWGFWNWLLNRFKFVRILALERVMEQDLDHCAGKFIHLRYLKLSVGGGRIPDSICDLWYLETLDLRNPRARNRVFFPDRIWKLKRLKHIYTTGPAILPNISDSDGEAIWNIHTLSTVHLELRTASLMTKARLSKMKKLGLYGRPEDQEDNSCRPHQVLENLRHLSHLRKLKLFQTTDLPQASWFPYSLTKITLQNIKYLSSTAMMTLENLPKLRVLKLKGAEHGFEYKDIFVFDCSNTRGFPQLEVFNIINFSCKLNWYLAEGAMPLLQRLLIKRCSALDKVPEGFKWWNDLQVVQVVQPSRQLFVDFQKLQMKEGCKLLLDNPVGELYW